MKILHIAIVAGMFLTPLFAVADGGDNHQVSRAEVRQQLEDLEGVGFVPSVSNTQYPDDIQAAERRLESKRSLSNASSTNAADGYGATGVSLSQAGAKMTASSQHNQSIYFGH